MRKIYAVEHDLRNLLLVEEDCPDRQEEQECRKASNLYVINGQYYCYKNPDGSISNSVNPDIKAYFVMNAPKGVKSYDPETRSYPALDVAEELLMEKK